MTKLFTKRLVDNELEKVPFDGSGLFDREKFVASMCNTSEDINSQEANQGEKGCPRRHNDLVISINYEVLKTKKFRGELKVTFSVSLACVSPHESFARRRTDDTITVFL